MRIIAVAIFCFSVTSLLAQDWPPGRVVDTVRCQPPWADQYYALYLPSSYDNIQQWPVIFFFEPAGRGQLPVTRYQGLAQEMGFILVGSHNSRNGPYEVSIDAQRAMFDDVKSRFNIDPEFIFLSGFSGGGRVAIALGGMVAEVRGVISCAGSFPDSERYYPDSPDDFLFSGIVGNLDMNYNEHLRWAEMLDEMGMSNQLIHFNGGHEWPPVPAMEKAMLWMQLKSGKSTDEQQLMTVTIEEARDSIRAEQPAVAYQMLRQLAKDVSPATWPDEVEILYQQLAQSKAVSKALKSQMRLDRNEEDKIANYFRGFDWVYLNGLTPAINIDSITYSYQWWERETNQLARMAKERDQERRFMAQRLIDIIARHSITRMMALMPSHDYQLALVYNNLLKMAWPENDWAYYWHSKLHAAMGNEPEALGALEQAIGFGFPVEQVQANDFANLTDQQAFHEIIDQAR